LALNSAVNFRRDCFIRCSFAAQQDTAESSPKPLSKQWGPLELAAPLCGINTLLYTLMTISAQVSPLQQSGKYSDTAGVLVTICPSFPYE